MNTCKFWSQILIVAGVWYLMLTFVAGGALVIARAILGVLTISGCLYRLPRPTNTKQITVTAKKKGASHERQVADNQEYSLRLDDPEFFDGV
jgi:hypothetical protein